MPEDRPGRRPDPPDPAPDRGPGQGNYLGDGLYLFQGRPSKRIIAYVDPDAHRAVKVAAAARGVTMSEVVDEALRSVGPGAPPSR